VPLILPKVGMAAMTHKSASAFKVWSFLGNALWLNDQFYVLLLQVTLTFDLKWVWRIELIRSDKVALLVHKLMAITLKLNQTGKSKPTLPSGSSQKPQFFF
jgi:hypothetical protein